MGYRAEVIELPYFFYRIHPNSSLLKQSRDRHLELFRYMVEKNQHIYQKHMIDALCLLEEKIMNMQKSFESRGLVRRFKKILKGDSK